MLTAVIGFFLMKKVGLTLQVKIRLRIKKKSRTKRR